LGFLEIGFVLQKKELICREFSTNVEENLKFKVENVKPKLKM